jgi:hypothetical protein
MTEREREVIAAAVRYVAMDRKGMSRFARENGRRGSSPWAELVDAVNAMDPDAKVMG